jgi:hypothetical protein
MQNREIYDAAPVLHKLDVPAQSIFETEIHLQYHTKLDRSKKLKLKLKLK